MKKDIDLLKLYDKLFTTISKTIISTVNTTAQR